jgi:hypothetical protein
MLLARRVKFALVAALVAMGGVNFLQAQRTENGWPTLVAAGEDASREGIKTYRVQKPVVDGDQVLIKAELLGAGSSVLGSFESRKGINGKISLSESLIWAKRTVKVEFEGQSGSLVVDGRQIYSGAIKAQSRETFDDDTKGLLRLLGAIENDLGSFARDVRMLARQVEQVGWLPQGLRSTAMAIMQYMPAPETLYADAGAPPDEPSCTGSGQCGFGFASTRTGACNSAVQDAHYDCTNQWCLGCCEIQNPGCDCDCVSGDFLCGCISCGISCRPPL